MDTLEKSLKTYFGYDHFNVGQQQVIESLMAGRSAAALFPTGAGKSLCYQLPAVLLPGLTLVVSPLIALMKDQIDALQKRNISAARLDSTLSENQYREVLAQARSGQLKLLYVAPERFNNERFRETIETLPIALMAIDEAHCISEWGHNFRPDYLKLAEYAKQLNAQRVLALTATATLKVEQDISTTFAIDHQDIIRTPFYRPNLHLLTCAVEKETRDALLISKLRERPAGASIIYVSLQKTAVDVANHLKAAGFEARAYHAGMQDEVRAETQEWFMAHQHAIVVATIAFGMGIDKSNIRYIYHYNLPKSLENYAQEIGRAGRDGETATCDILACPDDITTLENFIFGDTPTLSAVNHLIDELFSKQSDSKQKVSNHIDPQDKVSQQKVSQDDNFDISIHQLSSRYDIRPLVVKTLLTYLELEGYIQGGTPFYSNYRFKPMMNSIDILSRFEGERREFISAILSRSSKGRIWFSIDLDETAKFTGSHRQRVVRALDYLGQHNMLEVQSSSVRLRYSHTGKIVQTTDIASKLHQRMLDREQFELQRLQDMLAFTTANACLADTLSRHFGESLTEACGHCRFCLGQKSVNVANKSIASATNVVLPNEVAVLLAEHPLLMEPRILTRFLCGLTSPQLGRAKLSKHPLFGLCAESSFADVLEVATQTITHINVDENT